MGHLENAQTQMTHPLKLAFRMIALNLWEMSRPLLSAVMVLTIYLVVFGREHAPRRPVTRRKNLHQGPIQGNSINLVCSDSLRNLIIFQRRDHPFVTSIMLYWRTNYSRRRQFWCCRPWTREHRNVRTSLLGNRHDRSALFHHAREDSTTATADRWGIPSLVHHPLCTMFFVL